MSFVIPAIERLSTHLGIDADNIQRLTPDASTREFFRIPYGPNTAIACLYPEEFDSSLPQIDVTELFIAADLPVAEINEYEGQIGMVVHSDFGDEILKPSLTKDNTHEWFSKAIRLIGRIQAATELANERDSIASRLKFDHEKLFWEMEFFRGHYFGSLLKHPNEDKDFVEELSALSREIERYSKVLTHRDFHAANLMIVDKDLKIIDHQDARIGPATYDLVSLVLDRIDTLPSEETLDGYIDMLQRERTKNGLETIGDIRFEFDLVTIQRCLKAIGTFSNQSANAGKDDYLEYIAPMFKAVGRACSNVGKYPIIGAIAKEESERAL